MSDYQKKVNEAPYHPGYEDAVITPRSNPVYIGMDPDKMIWRQKPLSEEEINGLISNSEGLNLYSFVRMIEERHGIK